MLLVYKENNFTDSGDDQDTLTFVRCYSICFAALMSGEYWSCQKLFLFYNLIRYKKAVYNEHLVSKTKPKKTNKNPNQTM